MLVVSHTIFFGDGLIFDIAFYSIHHIHFSIDLWFGGGSTVVWWRRQQRRNEKNTK